MPKPKLKVGDISIAEIVALSRHAFQKKLIDNKAYRSRIDVVNAKITARRNMKYDFSKKQWVQTGREVRFDFLIKSDPKTYKKTDTVDIHKYPVTFLIRNLDKGLQSAFRWRTGSFKKPRMPKKGISKSQRQSIVNQNIRNGVQMEFFFDLEWVLDKWGLLFGPNYAKWQPRKTNPDLYPFFDKHAWYCVTKILLPLLRAKKGFIINKLFKN